MPEFKGTPTKIPGQDWDYIVRKDGGGEVKIGRVGISPPHKLSFSIRGRLGGKKGSTSLSEISCERVGRE